MESARGNDKDLGNSDRETENTGGEENFLPPDYFLQQADDSSDEDINDPFINDGEFSTPEEDVVVDSNEHLEENSQLKQHIVKENTSGSITDQTFNVNDYFYFQEIDTALPNSENIVEDSSLSPLLPAVGSEISPSSAKAPEVLNRLDPLVTETLHPELAVLPKISDSLDSQNKSSEASENLDQSNEDNPSQNVLVVADSIPGPSHGDHDYGTKTSSEVLQNVGRIPGREKPYVCPVCGCRFRLETTLLGHIQIHSRDKSHQCKHCKETFPRYNTLLEHLNTHTEERSFVCAQCNRSFESQSLLTNHAAVHGGIKPFTCGTCGKGFLHNSKLQTHIRTHTGEKPYVCTVCGKRFNQKSSLERHEILHTGRSILTCNECGKAYLRKDHFEKHCRMHDSQS